MDTDVVLDDGAAQDHVTVQANVLKVAATDLEINADWRRKGGAGPRRALVHDFDDGLTINFGADYPGGVKITSAKLNLHVEAQTGSEAALPARAASGDLLFIRNGPSGGSGVIATPSAADSHSLWLCVGTQASGAVWLPIQFGDPVLGTT
jgi:hypothetical protein